MTTTQTTPDLRAALSAAVAALGHDVRPGDVGEATSALGGTLLVIRLPLLPGSGMEVTVVAADRGDASADELVQQLARAAADELGPVVDGDASIEVAQGLSTVVGAFAAPVEVVLVHRGATVGGAVLCATDRRQAPAATGRPVPAEAPVGPSPARRAGLSAPADQLGLQLLRDVLLDVTVELGRTQMTVSEVLELGVGAVVELDRAARAPVDIRVNGTLLARGEVVVVDDEYAVRVTEIIDPAVGPAA